MAKEITNKELQDMLKEFPDDMVVLINRNGSIYSVCGKPEKKFMGSAQKDFIVLSSPV